MWQALSTLWKKKDNIGAFVCGDIMLFLTLDITSQALHTLLYPFLAGAAGILGKEAALLGWGELKKRWEKKKRKPKKRERVPD